MNVTPLPELLRCAEADGVKVIVAPSGEVMVLGRRDALERWRPVLRARKADIVDTLAAASVEPAPIVFKRSATDAEAAELAALIAIVFANDTPEERAEALAIAVADLAAALVCYRLLASCANVGRGRTPTIKPIKEELR